eukprot:SAG11_NODE_26182_length_345_cov_1.863454_1_plen_52_part_10
MNSFNTHVPTQYFTYYFVPSRIFDFIYHIQTLLWDYTGKQMDEVSVKAMPHR